MRIAPLLLVSAAGCAQIFGLSSPKPSDAGGGSSGDALFADSSTDALDAHLDLPDAAPGHCATIADCPTSVCLPSTLCAADSDVAWLSATGTLNNMCTMATPCSALNQALGTNRPYVRVHGVITNLTSINRDVSIFAEPGGAFKNNNLNINGGNVGLYELEFVSTCISQNAGVLTAEHIYVHGCSNSAAITANGTLNLDASSILSNRNGGVDVLGSTFVITNNAIGGNGISAGGSSVGGLRIESAAVTAGSKIDFNTIAVNNIKSGSNISGGLWCNVTGFSANGNVLAENLVNGSSAVAYANTGGSCQNVSSVIATSVANLGFANPNMLDLHITATSPLRDAATVAGPATDFDGEPRPYGSAYDIGGDEYHP